MVHVACAEDVRVMNEDTSWSYNRMIMHGSFSFGGEDALLSRLESTTNSERPLRTPQLVNHGGYYVILNAIYSERCYSVRSRSCNIQNVRVYIY